MSGNYFYAETPTRIRWERLKAARKLGRHSKHEWLILRDLFGFCVKCGCEDETLHKDHIVPLYLGGSDGCENLQPLCGRCNCGKGPQCYDYRPGWMPDWEIRFCLLLDTRPGYGADLVGDVHGFGREPNPVFTSGCWLTEAELKEARAA